MSLPNNYIPISNIWGQGLVRRRHVYSSKTNILAHTHIFSPFPKNRTARSGPEHPCLLGVSLSSVILWLQHGPVPLALLLFLPLPVRGRMSVHNKAGRRGGEIAHMKREPVRPTRAPPPPRLRRTYIRHPADFFLAVRYFTISLTHTAQHSTPPCHAENEGTTMEVAPGNFENLSYRELQKAAKSQGLNAGGKKHQILKRLKVRES